MGVMDLAERTIARIQLWQIVIFIVFNAILAAGVGIAAAFLGSETVLTFIEENAVALLFYYAFPLALLPVYSRIDNKLLKAAKQLGWTGFVFLIASTGMLVYKTFMTGDPSPFEKLTFEFSGYFLSATLFFVLGYFTRASASK
jgi:hypothetical protein